MRGRRSFCSAEGCDDDPGEFTVLIVLRQAAYWHDRIWRSQPSEPAKCIIDHHSPTSLNGEPTLIYNVRVVVTLLQQSFSHQWAEARALTDEIATAKVT